MATTMCQNHPDVKATFIGTVLEPEIVAVAVCDECMPLFCAAMFETMTGVDMAPALYLASEEGQANPDGPPQENATNGEVPGAAGDATEARAEEAAEWDRHWAEQEAKGTAGEPPAPAPADDDQAAADPTGQGAAGRGASAGTSGSAEPGSERETTSDPPVEVDPGPQAGQ